MEKREKQARTRGSTRSRSGRSVKAYRKAPRPRVKLKIIVNPTSGKFRNSLHLRKLQKYLRNRGVANHVVFTKVRGDAEEAARCSIEESYDAIAVCGGDGTLREVAAGVVGADIPVGIIPLGTGNVLATDLGIPKDPFKACELIIKGNTRRIDVGKNGDSYFLIAAGVGYDCEVVSQVNLEIKSRVGRLAYIHSAFKILRKYSPMPFHLTSDIFTGKIKAIAVVVANSAHYGGYFKLKKEAKIDDGLLDVIVVKGQSWFDILRIFLLVFFKSRLTPYDIFTFRTKKVTIAGEDENTSFHNDSDIAGTLPQTFEIVEQGLTVYVP